MQSVEQTNKYSQKDIKTSLQAETILFKLVNVNSVTDLLEGGKVYKGGFIPGNMEDRTNIAINTISMPMAERMQSGTYNVNAYVPFINSGNGSVMYKVPNTSKQEAIATKLTEILKKVYAKNYNIYIEYQGVFKKEGAEMNIVNFRVKFTNHSY